MRNLWRDGSNRGLALGTFLYTMPEAAASAPGDYALQAGALSLLWKKNSKPHKPLVFSETKGLEQEQTDKNLKQASRRIKEVR